MSTVVASGCPPGGRPEAGNVVASSTFFFGHIVLRDYGDRRVGHSTGVGSVSNCFIAKRVHCCGVRRMPTSEPLSQLPIWISVGIGGLVAIVAFLQFRTVREQWRVTHNQLILDQFERRYEVYQTVREIVARVQETEGAEEVDFVKSAEAAEKAQFLFGDDVCTYLEKFRDTVRNLQNLIAELEPLQGDDRLKNLRQQEEVRDRISEFRTRGVALFSQYIRFDQKIVREDGRLGAMLSRLGIDGEVEIMLQKLGAEFIGTFMLVASVCGAALFSAPSAGLIAVALAIGPAVLAMAYAVGHISGAHFNPAVTCGLVAAGRFEAKDAVPYIVTQVVGGAAAAGVFAIVLLGAPAGKWNDFLAISNVYGGDSHFSLMSVALIEIVLTALFLIVIVGATSKRAPAGFAPIAIGLTLTFIHLVAIPVSNASVNPARSTATAIFGGAAALSSLWLFWVAPIIGGVIGGYISRWLQEEPAQ